MIKFDNTYKKLPENFYEESSPAPVKKPQLLKLNRNLAKELGIEIEEKSEENWAKIFSGQTLLPGSEPIALAYSGHQFGHFNPRLGDGRAHLLGEVLSPDGERCDIQLKGSGRTRFSRRGDGLSWLGPVIREYVVSEAMHALGVPTTRALAAVKTGEEVLREDVLPGGIFVRVAKSHLRVGTFEHFFARNKIDDLQRLADYAIERHYPEIQKSGNEKYRNFFISAAKAKLGLVARWMGLGFIHGVMNTDNTSVAGITIDYGPCAFMDGFSRNKVFSSIDRHGRYAYANQGNIALWNLSVLANALFPLMGVAVEAVQEDFKELESFYEEEYLKVMASKLGIFSPQKEDLGLINEYLDFLEEKRLDFTNSFRKLCSFECEDKAFLARWDARLNEQAQTREETAQLMKKSNPFLIPRNHQVQRAIDACLDGDHTYFHYLVRAYEKPFEDNEEFADLALPPRPDEIVHQTFCGT